MDPSANGVSGKKGFRTLVMESRGIPRRKKGAGLVSGQLMSFSTVSGKWGTEIGLAM